MGRRCDASIGALNERRRCARRGRIKAAGRRFCWQHRPAEGRSRALTFAAIALVVVTLAGSILAAAPPVSATHGDRYPCNYHPARGTWHRRQLMRCEHERIDPPGSWAYVESIARCESGPDYLDARGGAHDGPFQQAVAYFEGRLRAYRRPSDKALRPDAFHFRSNVIVSYRMAKAKGTWADDWACA